MSCSSLCWLVSDLTGQVTDRRSVMSVVPKKLRQAQLLALDKSAGLVHSHHSDSCAVHTTQPFVLCCRSTTGDFWPGGIPDEAIWSSNHVWGLLHRCSCHSSTKSSSTAWVQAVRRTFQSHVETLAHKGRFVTQTDQSPRFPFTACLALSWAVALLRSCRLIPAC